MLPAPGERENFPKDLVHCSNPWCPRTAGTMRSLWLLPLGLFSKQPPSQCLLCFLKHVPFGMEHTVMPHPCWHGGGQEAGLTPIPPPSARAQPAQPQILPLRRFPQFSVLAQGPAGHSPTLCTRVSSPRGSPSSGRAPSA